MSDPYDTPPKPSPVFSVPGVITRTRANRAHVLEEATDKAGRKYMRPSNLIMGFGVHKTREAERILRDLCDDTPELNEDNIVIESVTDMESDVR